MINPKVMYLIDRYIGGGICLLLEGVELPLTYLRKARNRKEKEPRHIRKILFIKLWGRGSNFLLFPALAGFKEKYPDSILYFLTFSENEEAVKMSKLIDHVLVIRNGNLAVFAKDFISSVIFLLRQKIDIAVDFEFSPNVSLIIMYLTGAPRRIGFFVPRIFRGFNILTEKCNFNFYRHITESFLALVRVMNKDIQGRPAVFAMEQDQQDKLAAILRDYNIKKDDKLIVINVNAGILGADRRRWPQENFAVLAKKIGERYKKIKIVFSGSAEEKEYVAAVVGQLSGNKDNFINIAGKLDMKMFALLLCRSACLITNDSGPMHLAALMNTVTFALFGPETPQLFGPLGNGHQVFYKDLYCSPCHNIYNSKDFACRNQNVCLTAITVDEVFERVEKYLARNQ